MLLRKLYDLLKWLDSHPLKNDPEAYVWVNLENFGKVISPNAVNRLLKNLARKSGIAKPIHPHGFRYARATHLEKEVEVFRGLLPMCGIFVSSLTA